MSILQNPPILAYTRNIKINCNSNEGGLLLLRLFLLCPFFKVFIHSLSLTMVAMRRLTSLITALGPAP